MILGEEKCYVKNIDAGLPGKRQTHVPCRFPSLVHARGRAKGKLDAQIYPLWRVEMRARAG